MTSERTKACESSISAREGKNSRMVSTFKKVAIGTNVTDQNTVSSRMKAVIDHDRNMRLLLLR
jgi:hypothetical protein